MEKTAAEIAERAAPRAYGADVSDPVSVRAAVNAAAADLGRLQLVFNCAGIGRFSHSEETPFEEWQKIIGVNLTGTFLVCQAAVPLLLDGGGSIVNIASNAGLMGQPYSAAYCASKGGVVNLTRALADEYLKRGVRVNCHRARRHRDPLQNEFTKMPEGVSWKEFRKVMSPLGNSQPEEIANIAIFVASGRVPLHDRRDRVGRRRPHDLTGRRLMLDDVRSIWELSSGASAATPTA